MLRGQRVCGLPLVSFAAVRKASWDENGVALLLGFSKKSSVGCRSGGEATEVEAVRK